MEAREIIKQIAKNSSFSQQQIDLVLGICDARVPGYSKHFMELQEKAVNTKDEECVNLCSEGEIHYLVSQSYRIVTVIEFLQKALKLLGESGKVNVLDVGATQFTILYRDYFNFTVTALDRTDFLKERFQREKIGFIKHDFAKDCDIDALENSFDICIFTEVFEHLIVPPKKVFLPIKKVLKDGGLLIFSTPNIAKAKNRFDLLFGKRILDPIDWVLRDDFDNESPHGLGHIREYSVHELLALLDKYNFSMIEKCFPNDSMYIFKNSDFWGLFHRLVYKLIPSTGMHCQVLAQLQKA